MLTATITRETGKSVKLLLNDSTDHEKGELKKALSEEFYRVLESKEEREKSFYVLYGLHRIYLDKGKSPKSGWGNPVRGKNIGIGDDAERLYRIQTIVRGIQNPVNVSVESYIRLLEIMIKALNRLDHKTDSKKDFKVAVRKLKTVKNQTVTQIILKNIRESLTQYS